MSEKCHQLTSLVSLLSIAPQRPLNSFLIARRSTLTLAMLLATSSAADGNLIVQLYTRFFNQLGPFRNLAVNNSSEFRG